MSGKVRIARPVSGDGVFTASLVAGTAYGLIAEGLIVGLRNQLVGVMESLVGWYGIPAFYLLFFGVLIPVPTIMLWMVARSQRCMWRVVLAGAGIGIGFMVGMHCVMIWATPNLLLDWLINAPLGAMGMPLRFVAIELGIASMCGAVLAAAAFGLWRVFGRRVVVQTGTICWGCGYDLGRADLRRCPECGAAFDAATPPRHIVRRDSPWWIRRARPALVCLSVLILGVLGWTATTHVVPSIRFAHAAPVGWEQRSDVRIPRYYWHQAELHWSDPASVVWWRADVPGSDAGIVVQYVPHPRVNEPSMYVGRAAMNAATMSPMSCVHAGSTRVWAELDADQASQVLRSRAVPEELVEAIRTAAAGKGWTSTAETAASEERVDAARFFDSPTR
jgi:hypothetical protein